ncbi:hypothetical protein IDH44_10330 [Paenibacillus sp. IB182496]|uniref:Uncharacterized protein n=1 Tax=Paenibacillus sabuli TaxID=2772509 RepID=A0A927BSP8_9BACL|nr:hypothetical protein [Paenibacillus sabuli]MBD2845587.1 hypothetical protein [Paenibacillus sabuli]
MTLRSYLAGLVLAIAALPADEPLERQTPGSRRRTGETSARPQHGRHNQ